MENSCLICAEDFNEKIRKEICCQYCSFSACMVCTKRYILDQELTVCMNTMKNSDGTHVCQKEWTRKFVVDNFPKSWVNKDWKNMNAKVGVDKEKALFPATMGAVKQEINNENLKKEIKKISTDLDKNRCEFYKAEDKNLKEILRKKIHDLYRLHSNLSIQLRNGGDVVTENVKSFGRKCPDTNCKGYLSTQWKCELCEKWTCPDCHVIKGNTRDVEHICDPDTKATAQFLAKDTKPCPKCATPIHKIEGCDQMWCTQCHTGFSWRRGTIENRIHNPHYYEWLRNNNGGTAPRNPGDYECGRDITNYLFHRELIRYFNDLSFDEILLTDLTKSKLIENITDILRNTLHLHYVSRNRFQVQNEDVNLKVRVRYLRNLYDDKKFASMVHKNNKAILKKRDINDVIQLQYQGTTDIIFRIHDKLKEWSNLLENVDKKNLLDINDEKKKINRKNAKEVIKIFFEYEKLTEYSNILLKEHSNTYNCKCYRITSFGNFR